MGPPGRSARRRTRPRRSGTAAAGRPDRPGCRRCGNWRPARPGRFVLARFMAVSIAWPARAPNRPGIDAERRRADDGDVDAHAGFERAQLLELLELFERRRRQRDETLERPPPIGVEADMMVERPLAVRRGGAGEVERAQPRGAGRATHHLDDARIVALLGAGDRGGDGADIHRRLGEQRRCRGDVGRRQRRQIALHIDDDRGLPRRVDDAERLEDTVGARGVVRPRHHRLPAGVPHHGLDRRRIRRHHDRADGGGLRAPQHVHDHRQPGNIGKRLAGQPARRHPRRNNNERIGHRLERPPGKAASAACAYTGCKRRGKPAISAPPLLRRCGAISR